MPSGISVVHHVEAKFASARASACLGPAHSANAAPDHIQGSGPLLQRQVRHPGSLMQGQRPSLPCASCASSIDTLAVEVCLADVKVNEEVDTIDS